MELKGYQRETLDLLRRYLAALNQARARRSDTESREPSGQGEGRGGVSLPEQPLFIPQDVSGQGEGRGGVSLPEQPLFIPQDVSWKRTGTHEWDREAWKAIGRDPRSYHHRSNGLREPVPHICLKIPTGGGKTLLGVAAIDLINQLYLQRQAGLVLWIVPTSEIYRQTLRAFRDRAHPYRQLLDLSSGRKTLILEKDTVFTPADVREQLAVLVLMLPSASRQVKETLRLFRDQGGFAAFFPPEDRLDEHAALLGHTPNLDTFAGESFTGARQVKTSLGNTLRLLRPLIVLDEGHRAYSATAQETLVGFNPAFVLELSATPRRQQSNLLVEISGRDVQREGMIKLDLHLHMQAGGDWRDTLLASHERRSELETIARRHAMNGGDYIRPICLIQVEFTGAKQRRPGRIHAEDAREFLIERCNVLPAQVAVKSSECDELADIDLFAPECQIRYIITRHALQEGWDCSFAYVLAVLTSTEAVTSLTQLVGRVLRQPYGRKTGISDLDESYVYCFRGRSRAALAAVRAGLQREGLGELGSRVVVEEAQDDAADPGHVDVVVRPQHQQHAGRVYLPCFVVPDAQGGFREVRYEIDVLSRVDWSRIDLRVFDRLALNPAAQQDRYVRIGIDEALPGLRASGAGDMAIDLPFITRQLGEIVPSPWLAYELAGEAIARLRARPGYDDARIRRDIGLVIVELKQLLKDQRDRLAEEAFRGLVERGELRFYLLSSDASRAVPDRIMAHASSHRLAAEANAPLQCTALERGQHEGISPRQFPCPHPGSEGMHCSNQRAVALYLDRQQWVLAWYRNVARAGYSIQGWQAHSAGPDVVAFAGEAARDPAAPRLSTVYVLETKGLHLNNDATSYKHELCQLCNELSQPTPYDLIARQFSGHNIYFQVIFEDEWRRVINAMLKVEG